VLVLNMQIVEFYVVGKSLDMQIS